MKKIINTIFVILGAIFLPLLVITICYFIFDPFNLKSLLFNTSFDNEINSSISTTTEVGTTENTTTETGITENTTTTETTTTVVTTPPTTEESSDKHPLLSESQENILEQLGVDVSKLPTELTPEMEECFIEKLGEQRVNEIIEGATPNILDFFKARSCLEI